MTQVLESNTITDLYNSMANVLMYNTWNKSIFNDLFTSIPTDTITFNDTNGEVTINTTAPLNVINQPLGITNLSIQNPITEATVKEICGLKKKLEVKFTHNFIIRNNNQPKTTIKLESSSFHVPPSPVPSPASRGIAGQRMRDSGFLQR